MILPATVGIALRQAAAQGLARIDAQMLLLHALGRDTAERAWLLAHDEATLEPAQWLAFASACDRRAQGEPVAYITGRKAFYGLDLQVNAQVLDPRDDTETLVDWALELLPSQSTLRVLDMGTGSGAIALALQHHRPLCSVCALDASASALALAQDNGARLGLRVDWRLSDWFHAVSGERFHLIVSNPPYIAQGDTRLNQLSHEPLCALVSGDEGLDALRHIAQHAPAHLHTGAWLLLEHGYDQAQAVQALLHSAGFTAIGTRTDLAGQPRVTGGQWA